MCAPNDTDSIGLCGIILGEPITGDFDFTNRTAVIKTADSSWFEPERVYYINQLIGIFNMENINAVMINDGVLQPQRLKKLNEIAIQEMRILSEVDGRKFLK